MLQLLDLRREFSVEHQISGPAFSRYQFQTFWNGPLLEMFRGDERLYCVWASQRGPRRKRTREHSRFAAWIRRNFGRKKMVCAIICYGISPMMQTLLDEESLTFVGNGLPEPRP